MRQLGHGFGVALLRVPKMPRESSLVSARKLVVVMVLLLLLLLLLRGRGRLLLVGICFKDGLAVLLVLQLGRGLGAMLAESNVLSRVWRRVEL